MSRREPAEPGAAATPSFESMMDRLQGLVARLEAGNLSLDESIQAFEEGMDLVRQCTAVLNQAEQRILKLTRDAAGKTSVTPLDGDLEETEAGGDQLPF